MTIDRRAIGLLLVVALGTFASAQTTPRERSRADSIAAAKYVKMIRREEAIFLSQWRMEWRKLRDLTGTDPRFWSLHCHANEATADDEMHVVANIASRKSVCPIWYQANGFRADENLNIDNAIPEKSRANTRRERARIIAMLDTAYATWPGNPWVEAQRVRLLIDQREYERAMDAASTECHISQAMCAMLEAHAMRAAGFKAGSDATYSIGMDRMTAGERCGWLDISLLLPYDARDSYSELGCAQRAEINDRFWWLSDPL